MGARCSGAHGFSAGPVLKGGGWRSKAGTTRALSRSANAEDTVYDDVGFRRQVIDDFAFSFIAPLGANDSQTGHTFSLPA